MLRKWWTARVRCNLRLPEKDDRPPESVDAAMTITKQNVADKVAAYLHHEITLVQLVDWAESALMDGEMAEGDASTLSPVIARLGVADVRAFGLTREDCEELLGKLGFSPRVEVVEI
jgi:hypothetical protein